MNTTTPAPLPPTPLPIDPENNTDTPVIPPDSASITFSLTTVDVDGMPLAPDSVRTNPDGAWAVFGPATNQATSWHAPTAVEKQLTLKLLTNFRLSTLNGISKETTQQIMQAADGLKCIVCRVKNGDSDSYLLVYAKPGVRTYSGAFMMLRETKHSNIIILSPHDDSDGTYADTKIGMAQSCALACISNGHKRGRATTSFAEYRASDFVHGTNNLGTYAVEQLCKMFPASLVLHIHGMSNSAQCMVNCRDHEVEKVFKTVLEANTKLTNPASFVGLGVYFSVDKLVNTSKYLKTEMPASIHSANKSIIKLIALEMEKNAWAWA
jgi:hypothetical protein